MVPGQLGEGPRERRVASGLGSALGVEDGHREQEGPAVDRGVPELLGERDDLLVVQAHPHPFGPRVGVGGVVDEGAGAAGEQQRIERPLPEHVVRGDQDEQALPGHEGLRRGERRPVPELPALREHGPDPAGSQAVDDGGHRPGLVAHDHHDPPEAGPEEGADGPPHEGQAADANERLRAAAGHPGQPLGAAGGEDHADPRARRRRKGRPRGGLRLHPAPGRAPRHGVRQRPSPKPRIPSLGFHIGKGRTPRQSDRRSTRWASLVGGLFLCLESTFR